MFSNIKGAIFDLDGTLIDSMWIWEEIDNTYLSSKGIPVPENLKNEINHLSYEQTAIYFKNRFKLNESVEDILNRNYTSEYLNNISIQQKYLQVAYLSLLDFEIEDLEVVRNFIIQMDNSMIELFDSLWSREDEKRKEKLNELFKTNNNILERKK